MLKRRFFAVVIGSFLIWPATANAEELNAEDTQELLFQAPWAIQTGGEINYFLWNSDGTLCVKMYDANAENCDDNGTWTRDGAKVCYELPWWGKGVDLSDLCFNVAKTEGGSYEALDAIGLPALYFSLAEPG